MAHLNDLYEAQAKALLTKLCDALGMADEDRTKSGIEAAITGMNLKRPMPSCGKCGATGVKIYRDYGCFRREEEDRCNECIDQDSKASMVPCILDEQGSAWGYCSVPEEDCEAFYALPEKSQAMPHWVKDSGWSDSEEAEIERH